MKSATELAIRRQRHVLAACVCFVLGAASLAAQQSAAPEPPVSPQFLSAAMNSIPPKPQTLPLYEAAAIPNSRPGPDQEKTSEWGQLQNVSRPTLQAFLPARSKANGTSVLVFPGGGYTGLSMSLEGTLVAQFFQDHGTAAFVLKYRLPSDATMQDRSIGPLQDAQQAIRLVRLHAKEWNLNPDRVGVLGFSAGGHLAATLGTHFDQALVNNPEHVSLRPDFMMLLYPVISMTVPLTHPGSRNALLGPRPPDEAVRRFSAELQVTHTTPPTLLLAAADDHLVDPDNSIVFFQALRRQQVPVDMTIFRKGEHGFLLLPRSAWEQVIQSWMASNGWVTP